ncbi:MAG TPA: hypothetical protein VGP82_14845 [Ktedonobacterales bacterium]|nr:hypothetical protein [Ktedonobacterales bacterium]
MNRKSQVLFGAFSILIAAGLAAVGAIRLIPPPAFGVFFLALTILLLIWHRLALRTYQGNGVVIFSRGPWPVIVGLILIEAVCALDLLVAPAGGDRIWLALGYFLFGIDYLAFLPGVLLFWVADNAALTSQILAVKRSLPWREIDWLYLQSNETTYKKSLVTLARWKDEQLNVEAGPRHNMQVLIRTPLTGGHVSPLLQAIRARATNAVVGLDQLPVVQARRRGQSPRLSTQPEPNVSLHDATEIARGPTLPPSWTRFPVRRGIIWPNLIVHTALALFTVGSGVFIVASGTVIGLGMIPDSLLNGPQKPLVLVGEAIFCAGIALWLLIAFSLRWLHTLQRPQDYFFLVTPRYVAEVQGRKVEGVALGDVRNIHRSGGGEYGWQIVLDLRNGKKQEFDVGANYGPPRDLYAYVLAALNAGRSAQPVAPFGPAMRSDAEA